jgi:hypothetical protein
VPLLEIERHAFNEGVGSGVEAGDDAADGRKKEEKNMKKFAAIAMVALLLAEVPAYAQMAIPDQSATPATPMTEKTVDGVVTDIDLVNRTLTLQNGEQFTLPPSVAETGIPRIGEQVEVTYEEQGGHKVVHEIDMGFGGGTSG